MAENLPKLSDCERMEIVRAAFSHVDAMFTVEYEPLIEGDVVVVWVPGIQLSQALGENGANARLAAMKSGFDVEVRVRES